MIRPIHFQFWGDLAEPSYQLSGLIHLQWIYQKLNIDLTITFKKKGGGENTDAAVKLNLMGACLWSEPR